MTYLQVVLACPSTQTPSIFFYISPHISSKSQFHARFTRLQRVARNCEWLFHCWLLAIHSPGWAHQEKTQNWRYQPSTLTFAAWKDIYPWDLQKRGRLQVPWQSTKVCCLQRFAILSVCLHHLLSFSLLDKTITCYKLKGHAHRCQTCKVQLAFKLFVETTQDVFIIENRSVF